MILPPTPRAKDKVLAKVVNIIDDDDDFEIAWIKRQCRKHARNTSARSVIAIQALQVYLKALEVERKMSEGETLELSKLNETERIARLLNLADERKGDRFSETS